MQCSAVQCSAVQCSAVLCSVVNVPSVQLSPFHEALNVSPAHALVRSSCRTHMAIKKEKKQY